MKQEPGTPFDSIESAHSFVALLAKAVAESRQDVEADVQKAAGSTVPRRLDALRITLYNLQKLEAHMNQSRRILNDLRSLRRLLLEERSSATVRVAVKAAQTAIKQAAPPATSPPSNGKAAPNVSA
ncbi:MAG: hypothetical protein JOY79_09600 [Acidobacteriaceae bacterium]|nr:hypothetical protein [Acidobacteriaceae bacterium]